MQLVTFVENQRRRIGIVDRVSQELVDVSAVDKSMTTDMNVLIEQGSSAMLSLREVFIAGDGRLPLDQVQLMAPIPLPRRNIICVGKNYPEHVDEVKLAMKSNDAGYPQAPIFFTKAPSTVIATGDAIPASADSTKSADYEGELAIVIGKQGRNLSREQAMAHVFGYTIVNDVTSRHLQKKHQQWFLGKSLDGFCPMGPCIVTRDEIEDVGELVIETHINHELRQWGQIKQMIFDIPEIISTLSQALTLQPGDIIATGTPSGVGMGFNPPRYLQPGDHVCITIEPIGQLINVVE